VPIGEPMSPARTITDDELLQLPKDGNRYEVVAGELVMSPGAGLPHERVVMLLGSALVSYVREKQLGDVFGSNALYVLPSGNKRGPDVSFVAAGRLEAPGISQVFPQLAPDLAVEVLSPSDRLQQVLDKVGEYLDAGVRMVWLIDLAKRQAAVYRTATDVRYVAADGVLDGEDVLPGFRCPLASVLA